MTVAVARFEANSRARISTRCFGRATATHEAYAHAWPRRRRLGRRGQLGGAARAAVLLVVLLVMLVGRVERLRRLDERRGLALLLRALGLDPLLLVVDEDHRAVLVVRGPGPDRVVLGPEHVQELGVGDALRVVGHL